jgi:Holliday junction resolvasome RuvABC endonuclease subunit
MQAQLRFMARRRLRPRSVVGVDASATGTAVVVVPVAWDGDWSRITHRRVGYSVPRTAGELARIRRLDAIRRAALELAAAAPRPVVAGVEGYAYAQQQAAHTLGEVGGAVRLALLEAGVAEVLTPAPNSARAVLLELVPPEGQRAKAAVAQRLRLDGAPAHWSLDAYDAMAVANWTLAECGLPHLSKRRV